MTFDGLTGEGMTWDETGAVSKSPKGMVIKNGAYVGMLRPSKGGQSPP